ncbi:MAG: RNA 3'-terminal phosphate cyclase [Gammaproteobacteria bacterium]|nr:RNA 3'-terminal phosphate cyclase [Gammaproteobacteria bacterium]
MLTIDGSFGEGGGQVLRSALALSLCMQRPFRIYRIRQARRRPGLQPQHLAAVRAAALVGGAEIEGAEPGSTELLFRPHRVVSGTFHFGVETAGSTALILQTVLPALLTAPTPSHILLEGGTHNPQAPSFDFLARAFLPVLARMGPRVLAYLERPGFYPAGGGRVRVEVQPAQRLAALDLYQRGAVQAIRARVMLAHLPEHIAERESRTLREALALAATAVEQAHVDARGPGNAVMVEVQSEHITEVFSAIGTRGVAAEAVAREAAAEATRYLRAGVPVGEFLADQLLLPLALAGAGSFITLTPSRHFLTHREVVRRFLDTDIRCQELAPDCWRVDVG